MQKLGGVEGAVALRKRRHEVVDDEKSAHDGADRGPRQVQPASEDTYG